MLVNNCLRRRRRAAQKLGRAYSDDAHLQPPLLYSRRYSIIPLPHLDGNDNILYLTFAHGLAVHPAFYAVSGAQQDMVAAFALPAHTAASRYRCAAYLLHHWRRRGFAYAAANLPRVYPNCIPCRLRFG